MDDQTLLQDPVVLAALAYLAVQDGRVDAQERMQVAYDALVAANMWPAKFASYAGATPDVKIKTWKQAGVLKELPKPTAATQAAAEDLYTRLYAPPPVQEPPPVQGGFDDPPTPPATKEEAKQLALVAQIAALAKVPDALARGFQAATAMYTSDTWTLSQLTTYLAKSDADKLAQWANGTPYKMAWGMPSQADQQAALDLFRTLYAEQIADGTVQDPSPSKPPKSDGGGGLGVGTIVLVGAGLWLASKLFGGR